MKKRLAVFLVMVMTLTSVVTGCSNNSSQEDKSDNVNNTEDKKISVGLVTDEGGLNDKSFNQSANEGLLRAENELDVNYNALESKKKEDFEPNIQALVDNGSDLTFAAGYQLADAVEEVAELNTDKHFSIIDSVVDRDNVVSITFKEEEGSFLVGVIAGLTTTTNKVGFIGGKDTETIEKFETGFAAGVKAVNPKAAEGLISSDGKSAGTTVKYADSYSDTNKGYELAKSLYESGCDIIYHAAGGVGIGMFRAAEEIKTNTGKKVWGIGVDMDQSMSLPDYADVILTSMVKNVDKATYETVKEFKEGTLMYAHKSLGVAEDGVGIAGTTNVNASENAITECNKYAEKIKSGQITVPTTRQGVIDFK